LQTFKITDQITGRLMGIRADITPQVARIDAHRLPTEAPQRLCYLGPVLHTRPDKFAGSRNPMQVGAELYGHAGIESDAEIVCMMADVLELAGVDALTIELGHMGVFRALSNAAKLDHDATDKLLDALLRKAEDEVIDCLNENHVDVGTRNQIIGLLGLNGGVETIERAKRLMSDAQPIVREAIDTIDDLIDLLRERIPAVDLHVDLAELRGYRYHTGVTFAAYVPGEGRGMAWGGRYDNIGRQFGRGRAATGFSTDLKNLISAGRHAIASPSRVFAPAGNDPALLEAIAEMRRGGTIVVQQLPGQVGGAHEMGCTSILVRHDADWQLEVLEDGG
ncbi:MAG: ATP phosphoribosyltransferase regulatory subunit, partial [Gammaproteobacteria bacterium]|nr:ATP phosphoribosyltransferase regulatory subunit [Gammaproteobacteria bacterium]